MDFIRLAIKIRAQLPQRLRHAKAQLEAKIMNASQDFLTSVFERDRALTFSFASHEEHKIWSRNVSRPQCGRLLQQSQRWSHLRWGNPAEPPGPAYQRQLAEESIEKDLTDLARSAKPTAG